jgi:hypothetical protein
MSKRVVWSIAGACAFITMFLTWWATATWGIGASTDTVTYLSVARSLLKGRGFVGMDGTPMVEFPPLYPFMLSVAIAVLPVSPLEAVRWVSIVSAGWCSGLAIVLVLSLLRTFLTKAIGLLLVLFALPLWSVYVMGWSEPPFIALNLLLIYALSYCICHPVTKNVVWASVLTALGTLTRYMGVVSVAVGAAGLMLANSLPRQVKYKYLLEYSLLSLLPLTLWLVRNYILSGTLMGERVPSARTFWTNWQDCCRVVDGWFFPGAAVVIIPLMVGGLILSWMAYRCTAERTQKTRYAVLFLVGLCVVVYVVVLLGSASRVAFDALDDRLLSPIYVPLLLLVLGSYERLCDIWPHGAVRLIAAMLLVVLMVCSVLHGVALLRETRSTGMDFTASSWRKSPALAYVREHSLKPLFTNCPEAVYLHTGKAASLLPRRFYYATHLPVQEDIGDFAEQVQEAGEVYVLWFNDEPTDYLYSPRDLASRFSLRLERRFPDADLFLVRCRREVNKK